MEIFGSTALRSDVAFVKPLNWPGFDMLLTPNQPFPTPPKAKVTDARGFPVVGHRVTVFASERCAPARMHAHTASGAHAACIQKMQASARKRGTHAHAHLHARARARARARTRRYDFYRQWKRQGEGYAEHHLRGQNYAVLSNQSQLSDALGEVSFDDLRVVAAASKVCARPPPTPMSALITLAWASVRAVHMHARSSSTSSSTATASSAAGITPRWPLPPRVSPFARRRTSRQFTSRSRD